MIRNTLITLLVVAGLGIAYWQLIEVPQQMDVDSSKSEHGSNAEEAAEIPKGTHGGKLFTQDNFSVEVTIYETGIPPEFHVYTYHNGNPVSPEKVLLDINLSRLDGQVNNFTFSPQQDYLRGQGVVTEPHSFDYEVNRS